MSLLLLFKSGSSGSPYTLTVTSSAVTLTGTSVNLKRALKLTVSTAAVTLTGTSVNLKRALRIAVTTSAVTATGSSVNLKVARQIAVTSAPVTLTGSSVNLKRALRIAATTAPVTLTGSSVTLTYTPVATFYTLTVTSGSVVLTGSSVTMTATQAQQSTITGGGYWREHKPQYREYPEYAEPKPKKRKKKRLEGQQVILEPDPVIETGIIQVRPAWDVMAELQRIQEEAAVARQERLRAIALADDEWLMMA